MYEFLNFDKEAEQRDVDVRLESKRKLKQKVTQKDRDDGLQRLLDGPSVAPFFQEYRRDYLESPDVAEIEEIRYEELSYYMREKNAFAEPRYNVEASSKEWKAKWDGSKKGWSALDHATRFVVRALGYSWTHQRKPSSEGGGEGDGESEWSSGHFEYPGSNGKWLSSHFERPGNSDASNSTKNMKSLEERIEESERELYEVWIVLRFLQTEWEAAHLETWEMDHVFAAAGKQNTSRL